MIHVVAFYFFYFTYDVDVDVESVLAQAERLFASFSNFYFTNYSIKLGYIYSRNLTMTLSSVNLRSKNI